VTTLHPRVARRRLASARLLRVVNFHNTPRELEARYAEQIGALAGFRALGQEDVEALVAGRRGDAPGCLPVLYEGWRNGYDVALPLIEAAGLTAWFFIPTALIDTPPAEQLTFALAHTFDTLAAKGGADEYPDGRIAMTWDELRDVAARGHVVACHTATHADQLDIVSDEDVEREVLAPRRRLAEELGTEARSIAFLWGRPAGRDADLDAALRDAGYRLVFSATMIQRL
jgi:peptidoglycan/xylan/chitin deacetylase (PgdA/CDA1 family)